MLQLRVAEDEESVTKVKAWRKDCQALQRHPGNGWLRGDLQKCTWVLDSFLPLADAFRGNRAVAGMALGREIEEQG